jgi:hypothetical protein
MRARGSSDYLDLQRHRCKVVACGLLLPSDLSLDDWANAGRVLGRQQHTLQWRTGDWWNYPGHSYGDRRATVEADDWTGPAYSTCANAGSVCAKFEVSRRRENLTFSHHAEVAHLPPATVDKLLDWCEEPIATTGKPRSVRMLREEVRRRMEKAIRPMQPTRNLRTFPTTTEFVALTITPAKELQRLPTEVLLTTVSPGDQFTSYLQNAEGCLSADVAPEALAEAVRQTEQLLQRLRRRLRQATDEGGDKVTSLAARQGGNRRNIIR